MFLRNNNSHPFHEHKWYFSNPFLDHKWYFAALKFELNIIIFFKSIGLGCITKISNVWCFNCNKIRWGYRRKVYIEIWTWDASSIYPFKTKSSWIFRNTFGCQLGIYTLSILLEYTITYHNLFSENKCLGNSWIKYLMLWRPIFIDIVIQEVI